MAHRCGPHPSPEKGIRCYVAATSAGDRLAGEQDDQQGAIHACTFGVVCCRRCFAAARAHGQTGFGRALGQGPASPSLSKAGLIGPEVNRGRANIIAGTEGDDVFDSMLTDGVDVICGFRGDDRIFILDAGDVFLGAAATTSSITPAAPSSAAKATTRSCMTSAARSTRRSPFSATRRREHRAPGGKPSTRTAFWVRPHRRKRFLARSAQRRPRNRLPRHHTRVIGSRVAPAASSAGGGRVDREG